MKQQIIGESIKLLNEYRKRLSKQEYRVFKGQILSGDITGFRKGLFNLMKRKYS